MSVSKERVEAAYQKYARKYDFMVKLYRLIGLDIEGYRMRAISLMKLKKGDSVLDLGCGTGLTFSHILECIGPDGNLVGVDFSSEMLACAQERVKQSGWRNVHLVHSDISCYRFPTGINGVISTGVFGYLDNDDRNNIIKNIADSIAPNGRLVIVDGKCPNHWPMWLFKTFVFISSPFGLTEDYFNDNNFQLLNSYFENTEIEEVYGGLMYISSSEAGLTRQSR